MHSLVDSSLVLPLPEMEFGINFFDGETFKIRKTRILWKADLLFVVDDLRHVKVGGAVGFWVVEIVFADTNFDVGRFETAEIQLHYILDLFNHHY